MGTLSDSHRELQESEKTRAPRSCRQGGSMNNEVGVIAGVGLDQKTRKSHWPARLDLVQSASGLFLGLFMWGHMAFVSSILISKDAAISCDLLSTVISARYISGFRKDNSNVFNGLMQNWLPF